MRKVLGPVFIYEAKANARRWQVYAGRSLLVFGLMVAMALMWSRWSQHDPHLRTIDRMAQVGRSFFAAVMGTEMVLVLLVAPAATAGALCQEKARGGLALMMTTHLTDAEIVLGKLAARLATVVGIIACSLPAVALTTLLGGLDPWAVAGASLVVLGVAFLGVVVALTFSVWATKAHEALMATYAAWAVWLLTALVWSELPILSSSPLTPLVHASNPIWLIYMRLNQPGLPWECGAFFAGCLAISAAMAALSTWKIRAVALRQAGRPARPGRPDRPRKVPAWLRRLGLPEPQLDAHPVLWREWHRRRPSAWSRGLWRLYGVLASLFTALALVAHDIAPGVAGFQVSIALLLVSVAAATALAEERAQGSLDVVLATPMPTREVVLGKWWGAFRIVPRLAILPALLNLGLGLFGPHKSLLEGLMMAALAVFLVLAYGAAIVSVGLAAATWQRRLGRAIALSVTAYLAVTVVWPAIAIPMMQSGPVDLGLLAASPFFGMYLSTAFTVWRAPFLSDGMLLVPANGLLVLGFAWLLRKAVLKTFDRCLGRTAEAAPGRSVREPSWGEALAVR